MAPPSGLQIGELCRRLGVPYRDARYVLERGILPAGVDGSPGRGEHRRLTPAQAFWLGIVLKLKETGVKAPLARQIADFAEEGMRTLTRGLNWEAGFQPFQGRLETGHRWYVDIGDLQFARLVTDAGPSGGGRLEELPWFDLASRRSPDAAPVVIVRVDIGQLAKRLQG